MDTPQPEGSELRLELRQSGGGDSFKVCMTECVSLCVCVFVGGEEGSSVSVRDM